MPSSVAPRQPAGPTLSELPEPERQLLDGFRRYRFALAAGNPPAIVAAESAFLELAQVACDMARIQRDPFPWRGYLAMQGGQQMEDDTRKDEEKGPSDQGDGAAGDGESQGTAEDPAAGDDAKKDE